MFVTGFLNLTKPQWSAVLQELKLSGGLPVSELSRRLDASYMAVKQHCEDLKKLGYLDRSRVPRTAVGRPEIFYRLSPKADSVFPQPGTDFALELLDQVRGLFGESAPDRLLFQHFQKQMEHWHPAISRAGTLLEKVTTLSSLRTREGCFSRCVNDPETGLRMEEFHHPLQRIFDHYPRAAPMELRMIEKLLGTSIIRQEVSGGRAGPARVDFQILAPVSS